MMAQWTNLLPDIASWLCFIVGGFFLFVGSLGMVRLPDFWSRLHGASVIDSAGAGLIVFGLMFQTGLTLITLKLAIIVVFLLITGPTASHAVANAAFVSGSRPKGLIEDAIAKKSKRKTTGRKPPSKKASRSKA